MKTINGWKWLAIMVAALGWGVAQVVAGTAPSIITYQGQLQDSSGNRVAAGVYAVQARIWNNSSGGDLIWGRTYPVHVDSNGIFSITLGDGGGDLNPPGQTNDLAAAFLGAPRYLGISMASTPSGSVARVSEMAPRVQLVSEPYALRANQVGNALAWRGIAASNLAVRPWVGANFWLGLGNSNVVIAPLSQYVGSLGGVMGTYMYNNYGSLVVQGTLTVTGGVYSSWVTARTNNVTLGGNIRMIDAAISNNFMAWNNNVTFTSDGMLLVQWNESAFAQALVTYFTIQVTVGYKNWSSVQSKTYTLVAGPPDGSLSGGSAMLPVRAGDYAQVSISTSPYQNIPVGAGAISFRAFKSN